ncbi:uncharacterized protein LOC127287663 [Leptopilina boulardi]|uniref:uncharacterized protein LOC127287663 n=1 Tax=Leptopilina boulardi TaxID=63433 RepID=UPI0021F5CCE2|nr:uncharacterized protein LOC127287663 [Leptopilina boulardi]
MIKIIIICLMISMINSHQCVFNEYDLKILEKALHESAQYMSKEVKNEHVAICIGATRAGKSTLINYLIGNKLKAVRLSRVQPITIIKVDEQSIGPEIGSGSTSKTTIPTKWISKNLPDLALWDAPGFDDNRGAIQDITNAFYLYQLVQNVKSLKIVLAVDINDILHDNIKPFLTVLKAIENLLGNRMKSYFSIISIIFTKVPNIQDDVPLDMQYINEKLNYQFLTSSSMELSQISIDFVRYLIANNNRIAFFKRATLGDVTSTIDMNIFPVIKSSSTISKNTLKELHPSISDSSKICLYGAREKLLSMSAFVDLEKIVSQICQKKVHDIGALTNNKETEDKIRILNKELNVYQNKLYDALLNENNFYKKLEILQTIDINIKKKIDEHNLLEKIKLMEFVDRLLDLEESKQLEFSLQGVLLSSVSKVKEAISSTMVKLGEITQQKHDEIMRKEREEHKQQIGDLNKQIQELIERMNKKKSFWERFLDLFG